MVPPWPLKTIETNGGTQKNHWCQWSEYQKTMVMASSKTIENVNGFSKTNDIFNGIFKFIEIFSGFLNMKWIVENEYWILGNVSCVFLRANDIIDYHLISFVAS